MVITVYGDRSFTFELRTPPVSFFLKKAAKIDSGAKTPGRGSIGAVTKAQVAEHRPAKDEGLELPTPSRPR